MMVNLAWVLNYDMKFENPCHTVKYLFFKRHFYMCLFLRLSSIRIFQHIVIFRKSNIPSDKLRSCFYK